MIRPVRILMMSFLVMLMGCSEKNAPQQAGNDIFYITVSTPSAETKTVIGDKTGETYPVYWENGDRISLNGYLSGTLSDVGKESTVARFNVMGHPSSPYTVLYPGKADQINSVTFQQHQSYREGSVAIGSLPMCGISDNLETIYLEHLGAVLRLPLTGNTSIRGILSRAVAGEPLSGEYNLIKGSVEVPQTGGFIWLDIPSTVALSSEPEMFYIAIPAGIYAEGIRLTVFDENGYNSIISFGSEGFTAERGVVYELPQTEFVPRPSSAYFVTRPAEFNIVDADYIVIMNDMDMSGKSWRTVDFSGVIEGLGHELKGMNSPLVNNLKGRIHNLKIEADITISNLNEAGIFACRSNGLIDGCVSEGNLTVSIPEVTSISYYGGVCGRNLGTVSGCVNLADVTGTSDIKSASSSIHFGGLTGAGAGQILTGGQNRGNITYKGFSSSNVYVGGVTGRGTSSAVITGNVNYGTVKSTSSKNVGPIIGSYASNVVYQGNSDYSGQ